MVLSHEHKFIYVHIARTGGTSIEAALSRLTGMAYRQTYQNPEVLGEGDCKHLPASALKEILGDKVWKEYFTFSFVRNPYDRLLSAWCLEKRIGDSRAWVDPDWVKFGSFKSFLEARGRGEPIDLHGRQVDMVADENGRIVVDFIGRYENLQADFDAVCERIGLPKTRLPRLASSHHGHYAEHYTDESAEVVREWFADDFRAFGYPFEVPAAGSVPSREPGTTGATRRPASGIHHFDRFLMESIRESFDILSQNPSDVEALVLLGDCYHALGAYESAQAMYGLAQDATPELVGLERKLMRSMQAASRKQSRF